MARQFDCAQSSRRELLDQVPTPRLTPPRHEHASARGDACFRRAPRHSAGPQRHVACAADSVGIAVMSALDSARQLWPEDGRVAILGPQLPPYLRHRARGRPSATGAGRSPASTRTGRRRSAPAARRNRQFGAAPGPGKSHPASLPPQVLLRPRRRHLAPVPVREGAAGGGHQRRRCARERAQVVALVASKMFAGAAGHGEEEEEKVPPRWVRAREHMARLDAAETRTAAVAGCCCCCCCCWLLQRLEVLAPGGAPPGFAAVSAASLRQPSHLGGYYA